MDKVDLKEYLPLCYKDIVEAETEQEALSIEINKYNDTIDNALNDQFIQKCSLKAIGYYEDIFHIVADPTTESLEFRQQRVLSRMKSLRPPYTYWYLRQMLDRFFGVGKYDLQVNNNDYLITLESSSEDSLWYHEIQVSLTLIKPCNMIFLNTPRVSKQLNINETIYAQRLIWNYKLDGTWALGLRPFFSIDGGTVYNYTLDGNWKLGAEPFTRQQGDIVKMASVNSLEQPLFDFTLEQYKWKFYKARLNNEIDIVIEDYNKTVSLDTIRLAYDVTRSQVQNITNVKILDTDENVLENANVYIPVPDTVRMVHTLKLKEDV